MLELAKALTFFASLITLYWAAIDAFLVPAIRWQDRLLLALTHLLLAAAVCLLSGLIFRWPSPTNPDANQSLSDTLPMRLLFWAAAFITLLFIASWYLVCGAPTYGTHYPACS